MPGAEYGPAKRWPAAYYGELAAELARRGVAVVLLGSAKERALGAEVAAVARDDRVHNLCGVDLAAASEVAVSNDSGLLHLAAAAGAPVVAIYGSSSPEFTPPLTERARILTLKLSCSPCFARECPLQHLRCLRELTPKAVLEALDELRAQRRVGAGAAS
jgi:heptosyltransferase-2